MENNNPYEKIVKVDVGVALNEAKIELKRAKIAYKNTAYHTAFHHAERSYSIAVDEVMPNVDEVDDSTEELAVEIGRDIEELEKKNDELKAKTKELIDALDELLNALESVIVEPEPVEPQPNEDNNDVDAEPIEPEPVEPEPVEPEPQPVEPKDVEDDEDNEVEDDDKEPVEPVPPKPKPTPEPTPEPQPNDNKDEDNKDDDEEPVKPKPQPNPEPQPDDNKDNDNEDDKDDDNEPVEPVEPINPKPQPNPEPQPDDNKDGDNPKPDELEDVSERESFLRRFGKVIATPFVFVYNALADFGALIERGIVGGVKGVYNFGKNGLLALKKVPNLFRRKQKNAIEEPTEDTNENVDEEVEDNEVKDAKKKHEWRWLKGFGKAFAFPFVFTFNSFVHFADYINKFAIGTFKFGSKATKGIGKVTLNIIQRTGDLAKKAGAALAKMGKGIGAGIAAGVIIGYNSIINFAKLVNKGIYSAYLKAKDIGVKVGKYTINLYDKIKNKTREFVKYLGKAIKGAGEAAQKITLRIGGLAKNAGKSVVAMLKAGAEYGKNGIKKAGAALAKIGKGIGAGIYTGAVFVFNSIANFGEAINRGVLWAYDGIKRSVNALIEKTGVAYNYLKSKIATALEKLKSKVAERKKKEEPIVVPPDMEDKEDKKRKRGAWWKYATGGAIAALLALFVAKGPKSCSGPEYNNPTPVVQNDEQPKKPENPWNKNATAEEPKLHDDKPVPPIIDTTAHRGEGIWHIMERVVRTVKPDLLDNISEKDKNRLLTYMMNKVRENPNAYGLTDDEMIPRDWNKGGPWLKLNADIDELRKPKIAKALIEEAMRELNIREEDIRTETFQEKYEIFERNIKAKKKRNTFKKGNQKINPHYGRQNMNAIKRRGFQRR